MSEALEVMDEVSDDELTASICQDSFFHFFCEFWDTIEAAKLKLNWHVEYICNQLQEVYETWEREEVQPQVLINVPPGTSKSTMVTQLFPAWLWLKNPSIRIISSSFAASLSVGHAVKSRLCLRSEKFQRLYPGLIEFQEDQDGKTDYRNTKLGQRLTTSSTGAVTGNHADFVIIDDPLNPQKAASAAALKTASEHLGTLSTRTTDADRTVYIMVMQRIAENDPAGEWLASGLPLRHICLPGELTTDKETGEVGKQVRPPELKARYVDNLLDPVRRPRRALDKLKVTLGSYGYAGQVQQIPSPEEGGILKKAWFRKMSWPDFLEKVPGAKSAVWMFDADTANTEKQKNDPTAFLASAYIGQTLYVRVALEMRLEFPALKRKLMDLVKEHGYSSMSKFHIEPKANGQTTVQELRSISQLNVLEAPSPKDDKTARVKTASPFIEAGRVVLIDGSWNEAFISQAAAFPTAAHDDMLDCLTQAIARYNKPQSRGMEWGF